jgi:hypothetical protein
MEDPGGEERGRRDGSGTHAGDEHEGEEKEEPDGGRDPTEAIDVVVVLQQR